MKIKAALTTLIVTLCLSSFGQTPSITGNWDSTLKLGDVKLRLVLKITDGPNGELRAVMDSIDQDAPNLEVDTITLQGNVLRFEMKALSITYEGTLNASASEITGTFHQGST